MEKNSKRKTNRSAKNKEESYDHVIDTAFKLAVERGWRGLLLNDIAEVAGLTLAELHKQFPTKTKILNAFQRRTNDYVLASGVVEGSSYRDRLFGVLMLRFDILHPYRDAIRLISRDVACDPLATITQCAQLFSSMALMLEAAGINSGGIDGAIRVKGLALIYSHALQAWLSDDSPDLSKTMAVLDRDLDRAERLVEMLCPRQETKTEILEPAPPK